MIPVVEVFGPTLQGEGTLAGQRCMFIRTAHCNSDCVWCDTKYSWDRNDPGYGFEMMTPGQIEQRIYDLCGDMHFGWIVLTGGNPALHKELGHVIDLMDHSWKFMVETQGPLVPAWFAACDSITISPKLSNARLTSPITLEQIVDMTNDIQRFERPEITIKVVVFDKRDLEEAYDYYCAVDWKHFVISVGTNGADTTSDIVRRWQNVIDWVDAGYPLMSNVRILPQLHVFLWGQKRGV